MHSKSSHSESSSSINASVLASASSGEFHADTSEPSCSTNADVPSTSNTTPEPFANATPAAGVATGVKPKLGQAQKNANQKNVTPSTINKFSPME